MKGKMGFICIALILIVTWIPSLDEADGELVHKTIIKGVVTDSETGLPVEGALVMVSNETKELYHYYRTEANGSYEISVGSRGNFQVVVQGPVHEFVSTDISIELFEEVELNFTITRHEHNFMVLFCNDEIIYPLDNQEVVILDEEDNFTPYHTASDGWLNLTLPSGNYTMMVDKQYFDPVIRDFQITNDSYFMFRESLRTSNVFENASKKMVFNPVIVEPGEFAAVQITNDEPTSMFLMSHSDEHVIIMKMTGIMFDKYISEKTGVPYEQDEDPPIEFDSRIGPSYGGGGSVTLWELPYYIVFENNNTVPATIEYEIFYDYGDPSFVSIERGPLDPDPEVIEEEDEEGSLPALSLSSMILVLAMISLVLMISRSRRK